MVWVNFKAVYSVAKKEFMDNIRNRWIIALSMIFVILTVAASYLAGGRAGGLSAFGGMEETVVTLIGISTVLIPLIAIMLGYATISGEAERGALAIVMAYPIRRGEILLGKFIGLSCVLVTSTVAGFGAGGIIIAGTVGTESGVAYLAFIGLSVLVGLLYLSVSIFFSALCSKRVNSLGAGVLLFFWSMIYGTIVFGVYLATGGSITGLIAGNVNLPDWFWHSIVLSPMDMNQMSVMLAFDIKQFFGFSVTPPEYMNLGLLVTVQLLWIILPLLLAYYTFKRRDI